MITVEVLAMIVMAGSARFLIPKMMYAEKPGVRFGIGAVLFAMYNAVVILMVNYLCTWNGREFAQMTGTEVWKLALAAFVLVNVAVAFVACAFYFSRDRRTMSEAQQMKLKDL